MYWWYLGTHRPSYATFEKNIFPVRLHQIGGLTAVLLFLLWLNPHQEHLWANTRSSLMPSIYLGDDPNNPAPCQCLNNSTTLSNGQFSTVLSIEGPSGQTWTITDVVGLFRMDSPNPPDLPLPVIVGKVIPEVSEGLYQLPVKHIEDVGFSVTVSNGIDPDLKISAACFYPNPQFVNLSDEYCISSLPITLEADVGGVAGTGEFRIDGNPATIFNPILLGPGDHVVTYAFDAGAATSGDLTDPGCEVVISKTVKVLNIPSLAANFRVQIPLGLDCKSVIVPDMILEGEYPCIETDYIVNVLAPNGVPIGNTVTGEYAGQTLMVRVSTVAGGFSTMGSIEVVDNTAPQVECADNLSTGRTIRSIQFIEGVLETSDPSFIPANFSCLLPQLESIGGFHYFDLDTIRPTVSDLYSFEFMADFGKGLALIYQGEFNSFNGPCQGYAASTAALPTDQGYFVGENKVVGFSTYLKAGELYTILTTSANPLILGDYTWAIYGTGEGIIEQLPSTVEELFFTLNCEDYESVLNNPESLDFTGRPTTSDNCSDVSFSFNDNLILNGDCGETIIDRRFTVIDESGNESGCSQSIFFAPLTQNDIIKPPKFFKVQCDENFPETPNGNPAPSYTGYPMIRTFFGAHLLAPDYCNLTATYSDQMAMTNCGNARMFNRRWFFYDQCDPGNPVFFDQVIFIEDNNNPTITADLDNLPYTTSALDCEAKLTIPLPTVTDNCSGWEVITEVITTDNPAQVLAVIPDGGNREVTIPLGCHIVRYRAIDDCGNMTVADFPLCTEDDQEPVAICDDNLIVSLGGSGLGFLEAEDLDEGSEDNCGIASIAIRRRYTTDPTTCDSIAAYDTDWLNEIAFGCCDAGHLVRVELRVTDIFGNSNKCITAVSVTDKADPDCSAPENVSISCTLLPDDFDPHNATQMTALFGGATGDDNCSSFSMNELTPIVNLDGCGAGTIERLFEIVDGAGNVSLDECKQTVTITASPGYRIKFPKDVFQECSAAIVDTLEVIMEGCESLVFSVKDEVFQTSEACRQIFRTYRIEDQCIHTDSSPPLAISRNEDCDNEEGEEAVWLIIEGGTAFVDRDNDPHNEIPSMNQVGNNCGSTNPAGHWRTLASSGYWEYTQEILIFDLTAPVISSSTDTLFCGNDGENCTGFVDFSFSITETCSPEGTTVRAWIDLDNNGNLNGEIPQEDIIGLFPNFSITGQFPLGKHAFQIQVTDGCDNRTTQIVPIEIADCSILTPSCRLPFSVEVMPQNPVTDADGDGDLDLGAISILANAVLAANIDDCNGPVRFSIHRTTDINSGNALPDPNEEAIVLTCDDVEEMVGIRVYAWDAAYNPTAIQPDGSVGGPNYSFCTTTITLLDTEGVCNPSPSPSGIISGEIRTANEEPVEGVMMRIRDDMPMYGPTNAQGAFRLEALMEDSSYLVQPEMNYDFKNGVSTIDLVLISRHILGEQRLDSPYKMIAADINRSNNITTIDIILLRQLILGLSTTFTQNTSWRFIDAHYVFPNEENPWEEPFPEVVKIEHLQAHQANVDFIAVKIGDINGNAILNQLQTIDTRSERGMFFIDLREEEVKSGDFFEVQVSSKNLAQMEGFQGTFLFDPANLQVMDFAPAILGNEHVNTALFDEGLLPFSWHRTAVINKADSLLFTLSFRALQSGKLSDWLVLGDRITKREAYGINGDWQALTLRYTSEQRAINGEGFELYQNRPNPFSQQTIIGFNLPESSAASLSIFDMSGRLLKRFEGQFEQGYNQILINANELPAKGLLYYKLETQSYSATRKMIFTTNN